MMKMDFQLLQCGIGNGKIILLKSSSTNGPYCRIRHPNKMDINVGYRYKIVNKYT